LDITPIAAGYLGRIGSIAVTDQIKLVLFDMDNVLCEYDREERVACLAELAGSTSKFVYKAIWESGFEFLGDSGAEGRSPCASPHVGRDVEASPFWLRPA
jgi:hypothetical protein